MADKYYRLVCLITNICTKPLRALFLKLCQSDSTRNFVDLQNYLRLRQAEINHLKIRNIIRDDQFDLLYPRNGNPDVANWDVTLLVTLIKNLFKNRLSTVEEYTLEELRDERNKLQHLSDTSHMPDATFNDIWNRLQSASATLARQVSGSTYENEIDENIQATRINNMPDLGDALRKFYEEYIKEVLADQKLIQVVQKQMSQEITRLNEKIKDLQNKTDTVVANSAESNAILRNVTVAKHGPIGQKVKRLKVVDEILSRMKKNFQSTMSKLPEDFEPTYGVAEIRDKLQTQHHVVVSGSRGSRYLDIALRAILNLGYTADRCVEVTEASEWRHVDPEDVDLVLCRSPFGNNMFDSDRANNMYGQFDSILSTVKPQSDEKHLDFLLVTDAESLTEFKTTKEHELLEVVVKLFEPTSENCPEDLTGIKNRLKAAACRHCQKANLSRQITEIYLDQYARDANLDQAKVLSAKEKLKKTKTLLISGPPKSGKTALAVSLADSYEKESVLFLFSPNEAQKINLSTTSLVIIDEFVGKYGFDEAKVRDWFQCFDLLYSAVCAGKLNVIIICETENLKRCQKIAKHQMVSDPEVLSGSALTIKQELVSRTGNSSLGFLPPEVRRSASEATRTFFSTRGVTQEAANRYVLGTGQHTSSFPSENRARSLTSVSQYDVRMADKEDCLISGCCMLPNDEILLLDRANKNLKKLDASYRVTSKLRDVFGMFGLTTLTTLTYIGNSEVVICADDFLVYVNVSGNMSVRKTVELHPYCEDVTCSNDRLYVLYHTSIHICTLEGDTISVLPIEESDYGTRRIAVADDGRMYVTTYYKGLICLDSSGNVINTPPDVQLHAMCVDDRGNVWSGGFFNKEVYQISADGSRILNTLSVNTEILSMCYDEHRSFLIIGGICDKITVIGLN